MKQKLRTILIAILPLILFWFLLVPSLEPFLVMQGIFGRHLGPSFLKRLDVYGPLYPVFCAAWLYLPAQIHRPADSKHLPVRLFGYGSHYQA